MAKRSIQKKIKEEAEELALILYDIYKETLMDDIVKIGQNNANQTNDN